MWEQVPQLPSMTGERRSTSRIHKLGGDDDCDRLSRFGLPDIQRVLYAACVTRLASRLSKSGELHEVCGQLNVNVLLFEHVNGRDYGS